MTSIVQFSDVHFGVEDGDAMEAVKDFAMTLNPDLVLLCGDITQSGKVAEFKAARSWLRAFPGPKLITPGNHDTPMYGLFHRLLNPFGRYNRWIDPLSDPFYADANVMIIPYNTARGWQMGFDWSLGGVDLDALDEKIRVLNAAKPGCLKMVAVHHPFIYPSVSPLIRKTKNGSEAIKRLSDANIDVVFSGHVHAPFVVGRDAGQSGVLSIGSGTLSTRRRGVPASFNHILIDDNAIKVTSINWNEGGFEAHETRIIPRQKLALSQSHIQSAED